MTITELLKEAARVKELANESATADEFMDKVRTETKGRTNENNRNFAQDYLDRQEGGSLSQTLTGALPGLGKIEGESLLMVLGERMTGPAYLMGMCMAGGLIHERHPEVFESMLAWLRSQDDKTLDGVPQMVWYCAIRMADRFDVILDEAIERGIE